MADKKTTDKKTPTKTKSRASAKGVSAHDRRVALMTLLRKLGATGAGSARSIPELASKLGYTDYDVYCLVYHKYPLAGGGFVKTVEVEGERSLHVHLTAKGKGAKADDLP